MQAMLPTFVGLIAFALTFSGALCGIWLRQRLPEHHLADDVKETVKVGVGLVATMTALVLGLVTASAKDSFDETDKLVKHLAAVTLTVDRNLARYGAEAGVLRVRLKEIMQQRAELVWPIAGSGSHAESQILSADLVAATERFVAELRALTPDDDNQVLLKQRSLELAEEVLEARWSLSAIMGSSIPVPFLVVLLFWLTITFMSFGLFAPYNGTVVATFLVCALSIGSAVSLVLELDGPFHGMLKVSPKPMQFALSHIGQ